VRGIFSEWAELKKWENTVRYEWGELFRNGRNGRNERKRWVANEENCFGMGGLEKMKEKGE
jgi:hypothetical protein